MLTKRVYVLVTDGIVRQTVEVEQDSEGPSRPIMDGLVEVATPPDWSKRPTPTHVLRWKGFGAAPEWEEEQTLATLVAQGLDDVDTPADQARAAVLVKQTQNIEYQFAERDARAYRAADYAGTAGRGVSGWAAAKHRDNWTARDATDDILAVADRWEKLLYDIRDLRLAAKEDIRNAAVGAEIRAIVADFQARLAAAMKEVINA